MRDGGLSAFSSEHSIHRRWQPQARQPSRCDAPGHHSQSVAVCESVRRWWACTVAGGLAGGLLSAYWSELPPDDMETWRTATIVLYSALGAIAGLFIGGLLVALTLRRR